MLGGGGAIETITVTVICFIKDLLCSIILFNVYNISIHIRFFIIILWMGKLDSRVKSLIRHSRPPLVREVQIPI